MKNLFKNEKLSPWLILLVSFIVTVLIIMFLSWQYNRIAQDELLRLEEKVESGAAENVLKDFMEARAEGNEIQAVYYLTENSVEQKNSGKFSLIEEGFQGYEIINEEKLQENKYRYAVRISLDRLPGEMVEVIVLKKIEGRYFIDSVELAG